MPNAESSETVPETVPEIVYVDRPVVACDGGTLGHPRVFLNLGEDRRADCPYCGVRFVLGDAPVEEDDDDF